MSVAVLAAGLAPVTTAEVLVITVPTAIATVVEVVVVVGVIRVARSPIDTPTVQASPMPNRLDP